MGGNTHVPLCWVIFGEQFRSSDFRSLPMGICPSAAAKRWLMVWIMTFIFPFSWELSESQVNMNHIFFGGVVVETANHGRFFFDQQDFRPHRNGSPIFGSGHVTRRTVGARWTVVRCCEVLWLKEHLICYNYATLAWFWRFMPTESQEYKSNIQ